MKSGCGITRGAPIALSTRQMDIVRYIHDGPTTNGFSGVARQHRYLAGGGRLSGLPETQPRRMLAELMANRDYRQILNSSAYAPQ